MIQNRKKSKIFDPLSLIECHRLMPRDEFHRSYADFYATNPNSLYQLLDKESFDKNILNPACGVGHLSKLLESKGKIVLSSDKQSYGYGNNNVNFFKDYQQWCGDIIVSPLHGLAYKILKHSLKIIPEGKKVAMNLSTLFLEEEKREILWQLLPPKAVYTSKSMVGYAKDGKTFIGGSFSYAWYVWQKGYKGDTVIDNL